MFAGLQDRFFVARDRAVILPRLSPPNCRSRPNPSSRSKTPIISEYDSCNKRRPTNVATSSFFSRPLDQTRARFRSGESRPFCKKVLGLHRNQPAVLLSLPLTPSPPQHRRRRRLASPPSCPPPAGPPASLRPSPPSSRYAPPLEPSTSRDVPAPREPIVAPSA